MDILSDKVDAYGKALREVKNLEREIIAAMQKEDINRHFGKEFEVSLSKEETLDFTDRQKVVEILKEFNLLGKTLVPTLGKIKALLESDFIKPEQRDALLKLARYSTQYKLNCSKTEE